MKKTLWAMIVATFAVAMCSTAAPAKKEKKEPGTVVSGTLAVVKNDKGEITGATITTKSATVYNLLMEDLALAVKDFDGKEVSAKGEVKDEAGKMSLTVKGGIRLAVEPKAEKGRKGGKGKKPAGAGVPAGN